MFGRRDSLVCLRSCNGARRMNTGLPKATELLDCERAKSRARQEQMASRVIKQSGETTKGCNHPCDLEEDTNSDIFRLNNTSNNKIYFLIRLSHVPIKKFND